MNEYLKLLFRGRETGDAETDDQHVTNAVDELLADIRPFVDRRRPDCDEKLVFVKGDEDGQTAACVGTRHDLYDHLRLWLEAVYDVIMDCYGVEDSGGGTSFTAKLSAVYNNNGGQLWFAVDVEDPETENEYRFTFTAVELSGEPM